VVEEWLGKGARASAALKAAGGDAFGKEEYDAAVASYTAALQALVSSPAIYRCL